MSPYEIKHLILCLTPVPLVRLVVIVMGRETKDDDVRFHHMNHCETLSGFICITCLPLTKDAKDSISSTFLQAQSSLPPVCIQDTMRTHVC